MSKRHRQQKGRGQAGHLRGVEGKIQFTLDLYHTIPAEENQLSPARRLKLAGIIRNLGSFYFAEALGVIDEPDEVFNRPFSRLALCIDICDKLLAQGVSQ